MTTRLDRLILLLDQGSSTSVRQTAARQLGQIALQRVAHSSTSTSTTTGTASTTGVAAASGGGVGSSGEPDVIAGKKGKGTEWSGGTGNDVTTTTTTTGAGGESGGVEGNVTGTIGTTPGSWRGVDGEWGEVATLMTRVLPYFSSRSWDTRQAAASAVESICKAVGVWDPMSVIDVDVDVDGEAEAEEKEPSTRKLDSDLGLGLDLDDDDDEGSQKKEIKKMAKDEDEEVEEEERKMDVDDDDDTDAIHGNTKDETKPFTSTSTSTTTTTTKEEEDSSKSKFQDPSSSSSSSPPSPSPSSSSSSSSSFSTSHDHDQNHNQHHDPDHHLKLTSFDLSRVLSSGKHLLASAGNEFRPRGGGGTTVGGEPGGSNNSRSNSGLGGPFSTMGNNGGSGSGSGTGSGTGTGGETTMTPEERYKLAKREVVARLGLGFEFSGGMIGGGGNVEDGNGNGGEMMDLGFDVEKELEEGDRIMMMSGDGESNNNNKGKQKMKRKEKEKEREREKSLVGVAVGVAVDERSSEGTDGDGNEMELDENDDVEDDDFEEELIAKPKSKSRRKASTTTTTTTTTTIASNKRRRVPPSSSIVESQFKSQPPKKINLPPPRFGPNGSSSSSSSNLPPPTPTPTSTSALKRDSAPSLSISTGCTGGGLPPPKFPLGNSTATGGGTSSNFGSSSGGGGGGGGSGSGSRRGSTLVGPSSSSSSSTTGGVSRPSPPQRGKSDEDVLMSPVEEDAPGGSAVNEAMSARERNRLKRKRKMGGKLVGSGSGKVARTENGPTSPTGTASHPGTPSTLSTPLGNPPPGTPSSQSQQLTGGPPNGNSNNNSEVYIVDPGAKARARSQLTSNNNANSGTSGGGGEVPVDPTLLTRRASSEVGSPYKLGEWPWRNSVELLGLELFSDSWERRHGAAMGLREILKLQGGSGGMVDTRNYHHHHNTKGADDGIVVGENEGKIMMKKGGKRRKRDGRKDNEKRHKRWCDDLATKLLCVFALDRFSDYTSDHVVAPVRETASQTLAALLLHMPVPSIIAVNLILLQMIHQQPASPTTPSSLSSGVEVTPSSASSTTTTTKKPPQPYKTTKSKSLTTTTTAAIESGSGAKAPAPNAVWQVRHAGLLGLKYLVAVNSELLRGLDKATIARHRKAGVTIKVGSGAGGADVREIEGLKSKDEENQNGQIMEVKMEEEADTENEDKMKEDRKEVPSLKVDLDMKGEEGQQDILKDVVDAALLGLQDNDDDVKAAAAATLAPLADAIVSRLPNELAQLIAILWNCLGDLKDDLASSVSGVMDLLGKLMTFPAVLKSMKQSSGSHSLPNLIPRLFPFFRHTLTSVRLSVLNAINILLDLDLSDYAWIDERLLRLLFQNIILEQKPELRPPSRRAWDTCTIILSKDPTRLQHLLAPYLPSWFALICTELGTAMNPPYFYDTRYTHADGIANNSAYNVDKAVLAQDFALVEEEVVLRGRINAAEALGVLMTTWPTSDLGTSFLPILQAYLQNPGLLGRVLCGIMIEEWVRTMRKRSLDPPAILNDLGSFVHVIRKLLEFCHNQASPKSPTPVVYNETKPLLVQIRNRCQVIAETFQNAGKVPVSALRPIPPIGDGSGGPGLFSLASAQQFVTTDFDAMKGSMGRGTKSVLPSLNDFRETLKSEIANFEELQTKYHRQVAASVAGGIVALGDLPAKITNLIVAQTAAIQWEPNPDLQARAALTLADITDYCTSRPGYANPVFHVGKNLCAFLCKDKTVTPDLSDDQKDKRPNKPKIMSLQFKAVKAVSSGKKNKEDKSSEAPLEDPAGALTHRGARLALSRLCARFGADLFERMPKLWLRVSEDILMVYAEDDPATGDALMNGSPDKSQGVIDLISTVIPTVASIIDPSLRPQISGLLPKAMLAVRSKHPIHRYAAAKGLAALCDVFPDEGLKLIATEVLPALGDPINTDNRRGVIELISHLVETLDVKLLPYVLFFIVPVLGRMSDPDDEIRVVATNTFAALLKLVPLESGIPDPPGFSGDMLEKRQEERRFLSQLLEGKIEEYDMPVQVKIELRKYQREGISWLAFLAKYQLHGILCDDMGLGKTIQSICILGSKHHERAEKFKATGSPDSVHLPSLIVCPPTLTGHWEQEILTYAPHLRPLLYVGLPVDRQRLIPSIKQYDAVIMTYDIVRNDIDLLSKFEWNYCILDEGHVIRNSKTKLTKAAKTIRANHRLILSGTPIQNNVLELWSLFDFLMPGFLGTEKSFNDRFGKPILASRDAKSSSKEQDSGNKALQALHKQVLPFLLRRLKEDVLDDLPPKIIQDYHCELSPLQTQLYKDFASSKMKKEVEGEIKSSKTKPAEGGDNKPSQTHAFQAIQYLKKLVNHPSLVFNPDDEQHLEILKKLGQSPTTLHKVDNAPKLVALKQLLLDCGIGVTSADTENSSSNTIDASGSTTGGAVSQHRALIFCQLKKMLDIIESDLFRALMPSVTYMRLDGSTEASKRQAVVTTFNQDPSIDVLLLTTSVGGLGLNLTGADTVIFVEHDWNPMKDLQAMDRAHRLGQRKVVNVYRLITRGTLEEKIMGLQRFKLNIASTVVSQQNSSLSTMDTDQLLDLFNIGDSQPGDSNRKKDESKEAGTATKTDGGDLGGLGGAGVGKNLLEGLEDLPSMEEEYGSFNVDAFTQSLK